MQGSRNPSLAHNEGKHELNNEIQLKNVSYVKIHRAEFKDLFFFNPLDKKKYIQIQIN